MLRDFLDDILAFIDSESLTDDEFDAVENVALEDYSLVTYNALKGLLEDRESVSTQVEKLTYFFKAKGLDVDDSATALSNIFIGGAL